MFYRKKTINNVHISGILSDQNTMENGSFFRLHVKIIVFYSIEIHSGGKFRAK